MKNLIKVGLIMVASFIAFAAISYGYKYFYVIKYRMHTASIDKSIAEKEYKHFCLSNSYIIRTGGDIETAKIDNNTINLNGLWGHQRAREDVFFVIFSNDLKTAQKLKTITRDSAPHLFKQGGDRDGAHYCEEIK
jgi:hypothetical protein